MEAESQKQAGENEPAFLVSRPAFEKKPEDQYRQQRHRQRALVAAADAEVPGGDSQGQAGEGGKPEA